jgi:hypothetical protein
MSDQDLPAAGSEGERTYPEFDRRRGPRRGNSAEVVDPEFERRGPDRRKRKPGFAGLFGAIFGPGRDEEPPEKQ